MKILLVVLVVLVVGGGVASFALLGGGYSDWPEIKDPKTNPLTGEIVTELPSRPFILSTDNDSGLARPQSGISKADIVYEFPVEGGSSRLDRPGAPGRISSIWQENTRQYLSIMDGARRQKPIWRKISFRISAPFPMETCSTDLRIGRRPTIPIPQERMSGI